MGKRAMLLNRVVTRPAPSPVAVPTPSPAPSATVAAKGTGVLKLSVCSACGSTERTKYENPREQEYSGVIDGNTYTHIVWRSTTCVCGQRRTDKSYENRGVKKPK